MIGMVLKKTIVVKTCLEDSEAQKVFIVGILEDGWLMDSCCKWNTTIVLLMPVFKTH